MRLPVIIINDCWEYIIELIELELEVLEKRKPEDSSLTMTKTIKEEVDLQEAILRERKKTALIVKGIPENGKDRKKSNLY